MTIRKFTAPQLVLATHNQGKLQEFRSLLAEQPFELLSAGRFGISEPKETGTTFLDNAMLKARHVLQASGLPALADDSGLCIEALQGAPGVYTADWARPARDYGAAFDRIHREMGNTTNRRAYFRAVLVLIWTDGHYETVSADVPGRIVWPPRGTNGHGYDPIFQPDGDTRSFAEMTLAEKNTYSHRARAVALLKQRCFA